MSPSGGAERFKGTVFIGKNWLLCIQSGYLMGEMIVGVEGIEFRFPWRGERIKWSEITEVHVRWAGLFVRHNNPKASHYIAFTTRAADRPRIAMLMSEHGFPTEF